MLPTLKQRYEHAQPLSEALDTNELKKMAELLSGLGALIKPYDLPELQKGLQDATDDLAKSIGSKLSRLRAMGKEIKADPIKLAKVASFQTALIKGLKDLPHIIEIVRGLESNPQSEGEIIEAEAEDDTKKKGVELPSFPKRKPAPFKGDPSAASRVLTPNPVPKEPMDEPEREKKGPQKIAGLGSKGRIRSNGKPSDAPLIEPAGDDEKPNAGEEQDPQDSIKSRISDKAYDRIKGIMLNAFSPPGFLAMFRGMPYVKDPKMVEEFLNLPWSEFQKLSTDAAKIGLEIPVDRTDIKDIATAATEQGEEGQPAKSITIEPAKVSKGPEKAPEGPAAPAEPEKPSIAASLGAEEAPAPASRKLNTKDFGKKLQTVYKGSTPEQAAGIIKYLKGRGVNFN